MEERPCTKSVDRKTICGDFKFGFAISYRIVEKDGALLLKNSKINFKTVSKYIYNKLQDVNTPPPALPSYNTYRCVKMKMSSRTCAQTKHLQTFGQRGGGGLRYLNFHI